MTVRTVSEVSVILIKKKLKNDVCKNGGYGEMNYEFRRNNPIAVLPKIGLFKNAKF